MNIIERYPLSMTYGVCELCGNQINFDSLEVEETHLEKGAAELKGLDLIDELDPANVILKKKRAIQTEKSGGVSGLNTELNEEQKNEKIRKLLPRPEDLKISAETIEYTTCDEMSIINFQESEMGSEFDVSSNTAFSFLICCLG